ncbi:MAG: tetratricopeptide repeat protein, partial [Deltaproteobacteria bacterium]|nr:tetratricopeptide repeat protein [Deltaproteobacteria bacterium]
DLRQDFPDETKPYVALARFHIREGHPAEGETIIKEALGKGLKSANLHETLFEIAHKQKDHQDALRHLRSAADLSPHDLGRRIQLADYLFFLKMYDEAHKTYTRIARKWPRFSEVKNRIVQLLIARGQYVEALEQIQVLIAESPQNAEGHLHRGVIWLRQGQTDRAKEAFLKVLTLDPESVEGYYFYGLALFKEQEYGPALSEILRAVERRPDSIRARMALAYAYFKTGQFQLALDELGDILIAQPYHPQARVLRATVHLQLKNYEAAASDYRHIIENERSSPEIRVRLAETYHLQGHLEEALGQLEKALADHPESLKALKKLISIYLDKGQYQKAIDLCDTYLKRRPEALEVTLTKARILYKQEKFHEADHILKQLNRKFPESDRPVMLLAEMLKSRRRYESALGYYQKAIDRNPKQIKARMEIAAIYEIQGELDKGINAYKAILRMDESYGPAVNNLAYVHVNRNQELDHALVLAKKAHELMPDSPHATDTLGWAYLKKGALFLAKKYLDEAVRQMPQEALFRYHLGVAFYEAEDFLEAREAFVTAIASGLQGKESVHAEDLLQQMGMEGRS